MLEMVRTRDFPKFIIDVQEINRMLKFKEDDFSKSVLMLLNEAEMQLLDWLGRAKTSNDFIEFCQTKEAKSLKHEVNTLVVSMPDDCPRLIDTCLRDVNFLLTRCIHFYLDD